MHYPASKLPDVGLTIFSQMSALAAEYQAINLSQGFPDFEGPEELLSNVGKQIASGANQYAPMAGLSKLREAIVAKISRCYGRTVDPASEITVTSGATEAIYAAISAVVRSGDEVIVFDPAYDSYEPAIRLNGATAVHIPLLPPSCAVNWSEVAAEISPRTRMIIINTPHNPTGTTLTQTDLHQLEQLLANTDIVLLSDEVYEHIVFDGEIHQSVNRFPRLAERSFIVSSFGKTYHITGWKIGYCVAPKALMQEMQKVHQFLTFSTATPLQAAIAEFMVDHPEHDEQLPAFYQQKRDYLNQALSNSRLGITPAAGTYFQLVDYSSISDLPDLEFVTELLKTAGVAAIPLSPFYQLGQQTGYVRLCFAKGETTLAAASERLCRI